MSCNLFAMPWIKSCLCHQEKKKAPSISPPIHLLLKPDGPNSHGPNHAFRCKVFKKPRPCHLCHQPILHQGSCCRVCKYVCHSVCESKEAAERFSDTSWQIHRQWRQDKTTTIPPPPQTQTQNQNQNLLNKSKCNEASNKQVHVERTRTHSHDELDRNGIRMNVNMINSNNKMTTMTTTTTSTTGGALTSQPRAYFRSGVDTNKDEMDLNYVTERMIALWFPAPTGSSGASYRRGQRHAAHMLRGKHGNNYMVFNLSEPRRALHLEHGGHVKEVGWCGRLAPPLERLCSVCKDIDSWLSADKHRIAVLHARGAKERLGVVVAAYMHYSTICGTAEQALDRFSMRRFLDESIGARVMDLIPSNRRYVDYFAGLLSGTIRINAAPLYLTHVTVHGAPMFDPTDGGCKAFLKIYEGLTPVYTSGVYNVSGAVRQFTVTVRGLRLRGDILLKCYHRHQNGREHVFSCQFHTCAVADYTLSFTRAQLDVACNDHRFPVDGAVELHFSATPDVRQPTPAPTPAVPVLLTDDPITRYDSYENIQYQFQHEQEDDDNIEEDEDDDDDEEEKDVKNPHTFGPLDGSIYAIITKKQELSSTLSGGAGPGAVSSPLTVSMDSGISSAGHHQLIHTATSSVSPPLTVTAPLTPEEQHRELDDLLTDMLLNVENIPDVNTTNTTKYRSNILLRNGNRAHSDIDSRVNVNVNTTDANNTSVLHHALNNVHYIDDDDDDNCCNNEYEDDDNDDVNAGDKEEIPYHARQHSRPFTYGSVLQNTGNMIGEASKSNLASPSLVRKASFNKSSGDTLKKVQTQVYNPNPHDDSTPRIRARTFTPTTQTTTIPTSPYSDSDSLSPPSGYTNSPRSPEFHENLTWLQRQQQKLKERRDMQRRDERQFHETQLISELRSRSRSRTMQPSRHMRPTASHRLDGYTSDTTAFADDDDDFAIPVLHNIPPHILPNRTLPLTTTNERSFMAVKRAHEQSKKSPPESPASIIATGHILRSPTIKKQFDSGLLATIDQQSQQSQSQQWNGKDILYHEESWKTTTTSDTDGASPARSMSPTNRPQTPAFPVLPRTPYGNSTPTVQFVESPTTIERLPPKSPTTQRRVSYPTTTTTTTTTTTSPVKNIINKTQIDLQESSKDLHYSNGNNNQSSNTVELITIQTNTNNINNNNCASPPAGVYGYYGNSRRSSVHSNSNSEPAQEVSAVHVKFVRDTSKFWYKPTISREEAIALLRNQPPGTFIVRDSNSFPGAFGIALKVATPPSTTSSISTNSNELIRHFLIEPTSRGVRLKGCANEPVFSSLSALVYQHSITQMALPCKLILPEMELYNAQKDTAASSQMLANTSEDIVTRTQMLLLSQGAACNVLYLLTVDMESLTGPQAVRKAVQQLFRLTPLPSATVVHFKVTGQGITLTDNKRKLFFRKHYAINTISHCGLDPDDHRWTTTIQQNGIPNTSNHIFGFVARKPTSNTDNQCHIFAELEPDQPATAIVNFINKIINSTSINKANIL